MERRPPSLSWQRVESRPANVPSVDFTARTLPKRGTADSFSKAHQQVPFRFPICCLCSQSL